jgi:putative phosphoesterase
MSDSHDRVEMVVRAVELLTEAGAGYYVHCGDVCEPDVLDALAGLPAAFVWGNCDFDRRGLQRYGEEIGVQCFGSYGVLEFDGKKVGVLHGDDYQRKQKVLELQELDYLLQGHTHERTDERVGRTRLINPGALHRAAVKTVAILDVATDELRYITVASL